VSQYAIFYDWAQPRPGIPAILLIILGVIVAAAFAYCAWTDIRSTLIMNYVTYPLILGSLIAAPLLWEDWTSHLIIAGVFGVLFLGLAYMKIGGNYMFGMGDTKLYTAAALILGLGFIPCMLISCLTSMLHASALRRMHGKLIMGPHIALGTIIMLAVGALTAA